MLSCNFVGRVGRDAEQKQTPTGRTYLKVSVAVDDGYGDSKTTQWVSLTLWGKSAEGKLSGYLVKGAQVYVPAGRLSVREYKDKDGVTKQSLDVSCNELTLVGGKRSDSEAPSRPEPREYDKDDYPF